VRQIFQGDRDGYRCRVDDESGNYYEMPHFQHVAKQGQINGHRIFFERHLKMKMKMKYYLKAFKAQPA